MELNKFNKKLIVLTKPNWNAEDIAIWFNVSMSVAEDIKTAVLEECGSIPADLHKKRRSVCADDVIKFCGGTNRKEEIEILSTLLHSIMPNIVVDIDESEEDYEQII